MAMIAGCCWYSDAGPATPDVNVLDTFTHCLILLLLKAYVCHGASHSMHGTCRRVPLSKDSMSVCCAVMNTRMKAGTSGRKTILPTWLPGEWGPRGLHLGVLAGATASSKVPT